METQHLAVAEIGNLNAIIDANKKVEGLRWWEMQEKAVRQSAAAKVHAKERPEQRGRKQGWRARLP